MKKTSMGVLAAACVSMTAASTALAQSATSRYPITTEKRATADQVAQAGVPLAALAPDAPELYTVKSGDTLWDLSRMYLTSPWRWPKLWGMNKEQIANPHLIYTGQQLRIGEKAYEQSRNPFLSARIQRKKSKQIQHHKNWPFWFCLSESSD